METEKQDLSLNNEPIDSKMGRSPGSHAWDAAEEKRLVRKMDLRIFPIMIILFILNFIDRNNFANARLRGLEDDLNLTDVQYQTCISILLVGYVSMQIPSNMILNKLTRPSWYLCGCVCVWGVISALTALSNNATGAILCRFFLGCVEASFFPGSIYFLSRWYTSKEMQLRVTILNLGNLAYVQRRAVIVPQALLTENRAQGFGGLVAAGILGDMDYKGGVRAWQWLFIIEGAITVAIGLSAIFILPDYPGTTSWLSERERFIAEKRLALDVGLVEEKADESALGGLKLAVKDPKVWLLGYDRPTLMLGTSLTRLVLRITARSWVYR